MNIRLSEKFLSFHKMINPIPNKESVRYLGMILHGRMTWKRHIIDKSKQLKSKFKKFYWLIGRRSNLSAQSKIMLYKGILKPVWTYRIQLWGTASNSNIEILQRFQSKTLRSLIDAPWYVTNETIHRDLKIPTVKEEISKFSNRYDIRQQLPKLTSYSITWQDESDPQAKKTLPFRFKHKIQLESNTR